LSVRALLMGRNTKSNNGVKGSSSSSSSYSIANLGQGGLFRSQLSYLLVVSYVVVQVVVFLLDDSPEVVLGACCLPFYEHVGTTCVCMYIQLSSKGVTLSSSKISSFLLWLRR
jgi:hypothetical protein